MVKENHHVKVITSNKERVKEIEQIGAFPLVGKLDDSEFIKEAFINSGVVYTMVPPSYGTTELIKKVGEIYALAIESNGIASVVNLSGIGAHFARWTKVKSFLKDEFNKLLKNKWFEEALLGHVEQDTQVLRKERVMNILKNLQIDMLNKSIEVKDI